MGRSKMKLYSSALFLNPFLNLFGLMSSKVIHNKVNLLMRIFICNIFHKVQELISAVPIIGLSCNLSRLNHKGCYQRLRAMSDIFKFHPFRNARIGTADMSSWTLWKILQIN